MKAFESLENPIPLAQRKLPDIEANDINVISKAIQDVNLSLEQMTKVNPEYKKALMEVVEVARKEGDSMSTNKDLLSQPMLDLSRVLSEEERFAVTAQLLIRAATKSGRMAADGKPQAIFISAEKSNLTPAENVKRTVELKKILNEKKYNFVETSGAFEKTLEKGFGISIKDENELKAILGIAKQFQQDSILRVNGNKSASFIEAKSGKDSPSGIFAEVSEKEAREAVGFTQIRDKFYTVKGGSPVTPGQFVQPLSPRQEMFISAIEALTEGTAKLNNLKEKNKFRQDYGLGFAASRGLRDKFGKAFKGDVEKKVLAARQDELTSSQLELAAKDPKRFMEEVGLELDANVLVDRHIVNALNLFHFDPFVKSTNAMILQLGKSGLKANRNLAKYIQSLQDNILGKQNPTDEAVLGMVESLGLSKQETTEVLHLLNKVQTVGMMGYNLASPIINVTQAANILLWHGIENLSRGARLMVQDKNFFKVLTEASKLDVEIQRMDISTHNIRLNSTIPKDILDKMSHHGLGLFAVTESFLRRLSFAASLGESFNKNPKLAKAFREGKGDFNKNLNSPEMQEILTNGVHDADRVQFNLRTEDIPPIFRSLFTKNLFKFMRFPVGQTVLYKEVGKRLYKHMFVEGLTKEAAQDALKIAEYAGAGLLFYGAFKMIGLDFSDELLVGPTQIPELAKLATEMKVPFSTPIPRTIQELSKAIRDQVELGEAEWGRKRNFHFCC